MSKNKTIAMLLYPDLTALDLIGPHQVFCNLAGYDVQLIWKRIEPITSDNGLIITPTMTFDDCPEELAILFVPGGTSGTLKMMQDAEVLAFLQSRGAQADYVTSVCTGALVLGAAGLLRGYKATTHWGAHEVLADLEAIPTQARVVFDGNRVTGGGVTAGIDFGLTLAAHLKDENYAKGLQLGMEYAPAPPFQSGSPAEADPALTAHMRGVYDPFVKAVKAVAQAAQASWSKD